MSNPLKTLMEYNDVFADYMNVMMFHGEQVINPDDLEDVDKETIRKKDGKYPDDDMICKFWTKGGIVLRLRGFDEGLSMLQNMFRNEQNPKTDQSDYSGSEGTAES